MAPETETVESYLPAPLARRAAAHSSPPTAPSGERSGAAVLFADISGFTALAEQLAEGGAAGTEELSRVLNVYFGRVVAMIAAHGGEVLRFAGDAVIALWPAADGDTDAAAVRAARCGLALQAALNDYDAGGGARLSMRVGVDAGAVFASVVGGVEGRWEYIVGGPPLVAAAAAERRAEVGDVMLAHGARSSVAREPGASIRPLDERFARLIALPGAAPAPAAALVVLSPAARAAAWPFIPRTVRARLDAGHSQWLAEIRRVTVLFASVGSLDYTAPDAIERVQAATVALQSAVYQFGGSVNQLLVDDKGTTLVAAWGLPTRAYDDDAVRAVLAAARLREALASAGLRCGVGIATGRVFCGERGNALRREYAMIGNVVNHAARLMMAAGEATLCDEATRRAAHSRVNFEALAPVDLRGRAEAITVFRPAPAAVGAQGAPTKATRLVGRAEERARLAGELDAMLAGALPRAIVLEAEAGMGKSALLDELTAAAASRGVRVFAGAGDAVESNTAYHAWRGVLSLLLDLPHGADPADARVRLTERLAARPELAQWAPLLNAVVPLEIPENAVTEHMTGQIRADGTREVLVSLVADAAARGPAMFAFDDAHWLDSVSWAAAIEAQRRVPRALFVFAARPAVGPSAREARDLAAGALRVTLGGMDGEEVLALARARLGVERLPAAAEALIRERAEGNPFFGGELACALRDAGLVLVRDGECHMAEGAGDLRALRLPDTVEGAVQSRVDRLSARHQLTVKVASVFGRSFAFRPLQYVHPVAAERATLPEQLDALGRLDVTVLESPPPEASYAFKHSIIREVVYGLLPFAQRRVLHRATAEWYEREGARSAPAGLLAHHWTLAGDNARSLPWLERAGAEALRKGANREAAHFFEQTLAIADAPGADAETDSLRRARWLRQLGEAHYGLGDLEKSRAHFAAALELLGAALPDSRRAWAVRLAREVSVQAVALLGPSASRSPAVGAERERLAEAAGIAAVVGEQRYYATDLLGWLAASLQSMNLAERAGEHATAGRAYGGLGYLAGVARLDGLARRWLARSREGTDPRARANGFYAEGLYHLGLGEWARCERFVEDGFALARSVGDHYSLGVGSTVLGIAQHLAARFADAERTFVALLASARVRLNVQHEVWALAQLAQVDLEFGRSGAAALRVREMAPMMSRADPLSAPIYGCLLAATRMDTGDARGARSAADEALTAASKGPPIVYSYLVPFAHLAAVYLRLWRNALVEAPGEVPALRAAATGATALVKKYAVAFPIGRARAALLYAAAQSLAGRPRDARRAAERAIALAARWAMPLEHALAQAMLATVPTVEPVAAAQHGGSARRELAALGWAGDRSWLAGPRG